MASMILKSLLAGTVAAVVASALWFLGVFVLPVAASFVSARVGDDGGVVAVYFTLWPWPIPVLPAIAFSVGFYWRYRRLSAKATRPE